MSNDNHSQTAETCGDPDRAGRAERLLRAAETLHETGGAVELMGTRLETCDERGRTATTRLTDELRHRLELTQHQRDVAEKVAERRRQALERHEQRNPGGESLTHTDAQVRDIENRYEATIDRLGDRVHALTEQRDDARALVDQLREELEVVRDQRDKAEVTAETRAQALNRLEQLALDMLRELGHPGPEQRDDTDEPDTEEPDPHCPAQVVVGGLTFGCQRGRDHDGTGHGIDTLRYGLVTW